MKNFGKLTFSTTLNLFIERIPFGALRTLEQ